MGIEGVWVKHEPDKFGCTRWYKCSDCGRYVLVEYSMACKYPYCPWCRCEMVETIETVEEDETNVQS